MRRNRSVPFERLRREHRRGHHHPVGPAQRAEVLGGAIALLHLINFDEPFGYSVAESMACGTPVIAFERGSMPELIQHGVNGFLTHDLDEAVNAVAATPGLSREDIRSAAVARFGWDRMLDQYLALYRGILDPT